MTQLMHGSFSIQAAGTIYDNEYQFCSLIDHIMMINGALIIIKASKVQNIGRIDKWFWLVHDLIY